LKKGRSISLPARNFSTPTRLLAIFRQALSGSPLFPAGRFRKQTNGINPESGCRIYPMNSDERGKNSLRTGGGEDREEQMILLHWRL
jgi:hypothetical protein